MRKIETGDDVLKTLQQLNVSIEEESLGGCCHGFTRKLNDGYLIVVQEGMCFEALIRTVKHEIYHILLGHLADDMKTEEQKEAEVKMILAA